MGNCINLISENVRNTAFYKALKTYCGNDDAKLTAMFVKVASNTGFKKAFADWYQERHDIKGGVNFDNINPEDIASEILYYMDIDSPDGNNTVMKGYQTSTENYTNAADRKFCVNRVGKALNDAYMYHHYIVGDDKTFNKDKWLDLVTEYFFNAVIDRVSQTTGISKEDIQKKFDNKHASGFVNDYIKGAGFSKDRAIKFGMYKEYLTISKELLGKDINRQDQNLLAVLDDMLDAIPRENGFIQRDAFFDEVLNNQNLREISRKIDVVEEEGKQLDASATAILDGENVDEGLVPVSMQLDETIKDYDSHGGEYPTFMMHLSNAMQAYFNALPRLSTTRMQNGEYDYDTNNAIGLSDTMNAAQVATMLYGRAKTNGTIEQFIESIKDIAETQPGYEGLIKLYWDLKGYVKTSTNPLTGEVEQKSVEPLYAFAEELFDTFGKAVIAKKEIYIDKEGKIKCRISNNMASRKDSFRLQCLNSAKFAAIGVDFAYSSDYYVNLVKDLKKITTALSDGYTTVEINGKVQKIDYTKESLSYNADRRKLLEDIAKAFKWYYNEVSLSAILSYVNHNETINKSTGAKEIDEFANINILLNLLKETIDAGKITKDNYDARTKEAAEAKHHNSELRNFNSPDLLIDEKNFKDVDAIYAKEYISQETKNAAVAVADALNKHSVVKTQFNSRNAAGNNSSDIINNNMLTYLKTMLEHEDNVDGNRQSPLAKFARYKFRNNQYDLSNFLIEHRDENGNIINLGLFRIVEERDEILETTTREYVPTEYATELMKVSLFNGTSDHIKGKSALYSRMSKGDYLVSAYVSFLNSTKDGVIEGISFADYFLRTPSDAPKNFILSLPRYSAANLFSVANQEELDSDIVQRLDNIKTTEERIGGRHSHNIDFETLLSIINDEYRDRLYLEKGSYKETEDGCYVTLKYGNSEFVVKGEFTENSTKTRFIENVEFIGVVKKQVEDKLDDGFVSKFTNHYNYLLSTNQITLLNGNFVTRTINRNNPIYKQFLNTIKQEITDAATALTTMFEKQERVDEVSGETVTTFVDKNGNIVWGGPFANSDDPDNMTEENYHHARGKKVFEKNDDGVITLTGHVFKSDRFTKFSDVFVDEDGKKHRNVEQNYFEDLFADGLATEEDGKIHLLYGGYNTHLHINPDGSVELTQAQQEYIERQLDKFIDDYTRSSFERINEFSNLFHEDVEYNYNTVSEFILNYRLAYFSCADMLEGDSKCYRDFTDFLKRAKEVQGAGVPYSSLDYTREICASREELKYSSLNRNQQIQSYIDEGKLHDCKAYNIFRGVTVKNTIRTGNTIGEFVRDKKGRPKQNKQGNYEFKKIGILAQKYIDILISQGYTKEQAINKAANSFFGYADTKTNDAQSYITIEEWIRRISMRGQLPKYLPLIERIMDESKPVTIEDINEFVQVQKNFYYDLYYDKTTNHMRPRQIKNAEFVLVPRFIRGTDLEKVYDTMIEHGIDQLNTVETSKAGKSNVLTLWDNDGNLSDEWFNALEGKIDDAIEYYDYNFLYTQQETPQHVNTENKAAIQLMKKVIDNIPQYLNGKEHPLWKAKQRFHELYAANIKESNRDLLERLNVSYDEKGGFSISDKEGVVGMDAKVFCDLLKDELIRQGQDSQMMDYITLNTTPVEEMLTGNGYGLDTRMPLIANNAVRAKFESIAQALFNNNITRQTLPGFHAAQITGIGWKNDGKTTYKLLSKYNNTNAKKEISAKEWRKLSSNDRVKYTPANGIGTANDLKYHPAKYKNVETGRIIDEQHYLDLSSKEKSNYVLNGPATYIEVRVPKSVFDFNYKDTDGRSKTDTELLEELKHAGLDEFIGYRIPTEGKQSVAVMKVVGFIDDSYGSTIVVPDDWVAQTGSDFDIDSVYTVVYNNRPNADTNKIEKVKYRTKFNLASYISYIDRRSKNKISTNKEIVERKKALEEEIYGNINTEYNNLTSREQDYYDALPDKIQHIVKKAQQIKKAGLSNREAYIKQHENVINELNNYLNNESLSQDEQDIINAYITIRKTILNFVEITDFKAQYEGELETINEEYLKRVEEKAKALGLPTYEEYLSLSEYEKNTKNARSNELIKQMLDILKSDWSLEENMSQSQFRSVVDARDAIISDHDKNSKKARSPYDFVDQADNQEEAISGRALKGISVAYDNLISICNTVRPSLSDTDSVIISYPADKYDIETLKKRFNRTYRDENGKLLKDEDGNVIVEENVKLSEDKKYIIVTHSTFGWSNDNRNIDESFITTYSSQTTAHQLDVIKEGAIPNVNDYTFTVYKLFPAIGSNYDTAVAFMMQPGVSEIVKANNRSNSIYANRYENPIRSAIISLAQKINPNVKYYKHAVNLLEKIVKDDYNGVDNVLDYNALKERIKKDKITNNEIAFDYLVIKQFEKLYATSEKINAYSFVINPDKYGAKQSIFATNEILDKISDINDETIPVFTDCVDAYGQPCKFIDAIFPGISKAAVGNIDSYLKESDDSASVYKPLHAFMKYATIPSIVVNRRLFKTQDPNFRAIVNALKPVLSGSRKTLSEETNDSFASYIISYLYNNVDIISRQIAYDSETKQFKETDGSTLRERIRVFGFDYQANLKVKRDKWVEFNPIDKVNPKENEIKEFIKFSPAQKVHFIQKYFADGLACNYLKVNLALHNKYNRSNPDGQVIEFIEDGVDMEEVYEAFRKMFMNDNPFLRITAMDLIKYAYLVEGRIQRRNTVAKMIPNSILIESKENGGTGIVDSLNDAWSKHIDHRDNATTLEIVENYVRSHPNMEEISQAYISSDEKSKYMNGRSKLNGGMYMFYDNQDQPIHDFLLNKGIIYDTRIGDNIVTNPNRYVNISTYEKGKLVETLYRIEQGVFNNQYILVPLNKLENNEFAPFSANQANNKHWTSDFYSALIDELRRTGGTTLTKEFIEKRTTAEQVEGVTFHKITVEQSKAKERTIDIQSSKPAIAQLRNQMLEHFDGVNTTPLYVQNNELERLIQKPGIKNALKEYIELDGSYYLAYRLSPDVFKDYIDNDNPIKPEHSHLAKIINTIRSYNGKEDAYKNVFCIQLVSGNDQNYTRHSTVIERPIAKSVVDAHKLINHIASTGDATAAKASRINTADGIEPNTKSVKEHLETSLINTKEWLKQEVEILINGNENRPGLNMFTIDPDTQKRIKMTDPKVFTMMLDNAQLHRSYLQLYLDCVRIIETFEKFDYSSYTDEEAGLQSHVDEIRSYVDRLRNNKVFKEAERLYVTEHLAKVSKNPNIQQNIISLLEGYHKTSYVTSFFNDLQDTSNPIIQIITKDVMADIRAKELQSEEAIAAFDKKVSDIFARANAAGVSINEDKIVDANGNYIEDFDEKFREDLYKYREELKDKHAAYVNSNGTELEKIRLYEDYLKAKYEYDKFLLKNVNREIEDNYYHELLQNTESMMYDDGRFFEIYVEYERLNDDLRRLNKLADQDGLIDPAINKQIKEIEKKINDLVNPVYFDEFGNIISKIDDETSYNDAEKDRLRKMFSATQAAKLSEYLRLKDAIQSEYIKYDEKESFRDLLERYQEVVNRYEDIDPVTGSPRRNEADLATIPEYTYAKNWLRENVIFRYGLNKKERDRLTATDVKTYLEKYFNGEISEDSEEFKYVVASASKYFSSKTGTKSNPKAAYKAIAKERNARDEDGVIDARKFTEEDLEFIRSEELKKLGLAEDNRYSERSIIHNSSSDDVIYKETFYKQMMVGGITNPKYREIVQEINAILRKAFVIETRTLKTAYKLSEDDLQKLLDIFVDKLGYDIDDQTFDKSSGTKTKIGVNKTRRKEVAHFIKKNVDFVLSEEDEKEFEIQKAHSESRGESYYKLWCTLNQEWNEEKQEFVPNHVLWGHAVPKESVREKYTDKQKTAAVRAMQYAYNNEVSKYYQEEQSRLIRTYGRGSDEYKKWFDLNHIYNPNTHTFEPLPCWTVHSVNSRIKQDAIPTYQMRTKSIAEGHENKNYKHNFGYVDNYKGISTRDKQTEDNKSNFGNRHFKTTEEAYRNACIPDGNYDNKNDLNIYEQELKDLYKQTIASMCKTQQAKRYFENTMPVMAKDGSQKSGWLEEIGKTFGIVDTNKKVHWQGDSEIGYNIDRIPPMPMTGMLKTKDSVEPPIRDKFETDEGYNKALKEYEEHKAEHDKKNQEIHNNLLNRNWKEVIKEFMHEAAHYNAVQDNKYALYFGQRLLEDIKVYETRADNPSKLRQTKQSSAEEDVEYKKSVDNALLDQYNNWLHRIIYNHYKQTQGVGETIGNILQGFTSTSYMTINVRAGIANILVGDSNIIGEAFAKQYFGVKDWAAGKALWASSLGDYILHMYDDKSDTKVGAIIKGMNIVDYDELNGRVSKLNPKEFSEIITRVGFMPNSAGEHMMQNGAMLSMMLSHKVIENPNYGEPGEKQYIVVNFEEYAAKIREQVLNEIATKEQKEAYYSWIKTIKNNPNGAKNFAWFREDPISKFILDNFSTEQRKQFKKRVKELRDNTEKEFKSAKSVFDQLDKNEDGKMTFAKGSIFEELNTVREGQEVSDAYRLLGEFKGRVISVNKKIHGNYGKLDSARVEKWYLGRLAMQYHKHIPVGILKRYRTKGYFNEERGTVEKGTYQSIVDFLAFPVRAMQERGEISEDQANALKGIQNIFNYCVDYFKYLSAYADIMPEYEKANLRRNLGDITGMIFAVAGALAIKIGWDDDDSIAYNLLIYEMDRLASEAFMWNPYGAFAEAKKQWSSPIAAGTIVTDCYRILETCCGIIFEGEDYDPYYHSGRFAGRHKLGVYIERRIPYYRNYATIRDIADNNHYYKLGDNILSWIPVEDIANSIKGK